MMRIVSDDDDEEEEEEEKEVEEEDGDYGQWSPAGRPRCVRREGCM